MELRLLRYFLAVARESTITKSLNRFIFRDRPYQFSSKN